MVSYTPDNMLTLGKFDLLKELTIYKLLSLTLFSFSVTVFPFIF